jgi:hypothetical protein
MLLSLKFPNQKFACRPHIRVHGACLIQIALIPPVDVSSRFSVSLVSCHHHVNEKPESVSFFFSMFDINAAGTRLRRS